MKKFMILFSILFIFLVSTNTKGQWVQTNGLTQTVRGLAIIGNNIFAATESGVELTTNYGQNWTHTSLQGQEINTVMLSGTTIFAGLYGVYFSTNAGLNWILSTLSDRIIYSLGKNDNYIFAGDDRNGVYSSSNNGLSWIHTSLYYVDVFTIATSSTHIFAGGDAGLFHSSNNGTSWNMINDHTTFSLAVNGAFIVQGTMSSGVFTSTNLGQNWTQSSLNNHSIFALTIDGPYIFAGCENGVFLSTNRGLTWAQKNEGLGNNFFISSFLITGNDIFLSTLGHSVWKRSLPELIGIKPISSEVPKTFSLSQNYPNPFNPSTKIKFDVATSPVPSKGGGQVVSLKVFDILGREVATLVNESAASGLKPGTYEVEWDATSYPSGVYFYKLTATEFTETKRMVLVK